ncbi:thiamine-phosphate kinase [Hydrogenimonas cancrithermarum]|uniref:Thiamine-monophosphate kinase n=1 Tax=Hydrogenimonas cancrithermarum TaxID=2993563 RepID=A0ABM8FHS4_9BACT|nr:thiamine-phosphate kinase [Hydrogenimonas cancrithermarum]BDY11836.1 thiamine-monophosphate kinase [Hydrogenimonas cancrithermarum]
MNKEDYFIGCFAETPFIGDDAAILNDMCISQDAFFENVHFKREWMSLYEIARKAMLVNISDAIVMNGRPKYALLTVAIPKHYTRKELKELARGFQETADAFGITIIGGDTIANIKLDISITIMAECSRPILRSGMKEGDLLAYTGRLGESRRDLQRLLRGASVNPGSRFVHPVLRDRFFYKAAPFIRSAMDISDGLFHDLEKLHRANRLGFDFFVPIPKPVGCSGEEFEVLFAFDPRHEKRIRHIARLTRTPLTVFARAVRKPYHNLCRPNHF